MSCNSVWWCRQPRYLRPSWFSILFFQMSFHGHTDYIHCVTIRPSGQQFLSASEDGTVRLWGRWPRPSVVHFMRGGAGSFIHSGYFYSTSSSPLLLRGTPNYSIYIVLELTCRTATGNYEWRTCPRSLRGVRHRTYHWAITPHVRSATMSNGSSRNRCPQNCFLAVLWTGWWLNLW